MCFFSIEKQLNFACKNCSALAPWFFPIHRLLFKFTTKDLINYLKQNYEMCNVMLKQSADKRGDSTFLVQKNEHYIVGIYASGQLYRYQRVQVFGNVLEATADYILLNWKLPRLRILDSEQNLNYLPKD